MEPTEANFDSLERKFSTEIAELRAELRLEQAAAMERQDDTLANELAEALRQSEELLEQLRRLRDIANYVQAVPGRHFTAEEVDALRYFGFNPNRVHFPKDATTPPASNDDLDGASPAPRPVVGQQQPQQQHHHQERHPHHTSPLPLRPNTSLSPERYQHADHHHHHHQQQQQQQQPSVAMTNKQSAPVRVTTTPTMGEGLSRSRSGSGGGGGGGGAANPPGVIRYTRAPNAAPAVPLSEELATPTSHTNDPLATSGRFTDAGSSVSMSAVNSAGFLQQHHVAVPTLHVGVSSSSESRPRPGHALPQDTIHVPLVSPEKETDPTKSSPSPLTRGRLQQHQHHERFARDKTAEIGAGGGGRSPIPGSHRKSSPLRTAAGPASPVSAADVSRGGGGGSSPALGALEKTVNDVVARRLARTVPTAARNPDESTRVMREVQHKILTSDKFSALLEDAVQHAAFVAGGRAAAAAAAASPIKSPTKRRQPTQNEQDLLNALRSDNLALQQQVARLQMREKETVQRSGANMGAAAGTSPWGGGGGGRAITSPVKRQTTTSPLKRQNTGSPVKSTANLAVHAEMEKLTSRCVELERTNAQLKSKLRSASNAVGQLGAASPTRLASAVAGLDRVLTQGQSALRAAEFLRRPNPQYESGAAGGSAAQRFAQQVGRVRGGIPEWAGVLPFVVDAQRGIAHSITGISVPCDGESVTALLEKTVVENPAPASSQAHQHQQEQQRQRDGSVENQGLLRVAAAAAARSPSLGQQQRALSKSASPRPQQQQQQVSPTPRVPNNNRQHEISAIPLAAELSTHANNTSQFHEHVTPPKQQQHQNQQQQQQQQKLCEHRSGSREKTLSPGSAASPSIELATLQRLQEERDALAALHQVQKSQSASMNRAASEPLMQQQQQQHHHHSQNTTRVASPRVIRVVQPSSSAATAETSRSADAASLFHHQQQQQQQQQQQNRKSAFSSVSHSKTPRGAGGGATDAASTASKSGGGSGVSSSAAKQRGGSNSGKNFIERNKSNISAASAALSSSAALDAHTFQSLAAAGQRHEQDPAPAQSTHASQNGAPPAETVLSRIGPEVLRTMTPAEIEVLKRVALTQQLREQKRRTEIQMSNNFAAASHQRRRGM